MPKANSPVAESVAEAGLPLVKSTQGPTLSAALESARARFESKNPTSKKLYEEACGSLPGGNTRSLLFAPPYPIFMKSGQEWRVTSEDGQTYTDFVGELTSGLYGHSHPVLQEAIINTVKNVGLNLGATIAQETVHANLIRERFSIDKVRFTNSGTEANLHALGAARRFTGKSKVVVFDGAYHGSVLSFWNGPLPNDVDKNDFVIGTYNDVESAKSVIERGDIAAVLVEGMQGAGGCINGTDEFLFQIQESAKKAGVVFILDEVMTSRLGPAGLGGIVGLQPDMKTFGKYLGGGVAFGAFGGRSEIMAVYDPREPNALAHSGTFNNNTLAMHAGHAGLSKVWTQDVAFEFNKMGDAFRDKLNEVSQGTKLSFTGRGALLGTHLSSEGKVDILRKDDLVEDSDLKDLFYMEMLEEGFFMPRRGSISLILGTPQSELDRFVHAVGGWLEKYKDFVKL